MLNYPLDAHLILRKKHAIKKELLLKEHFLTKNIAILGGSTTAEIKNILELFLLDIGIKPNFYESKYNQYFEEAVFDNEPLQQFNPDIIYIHTTNKNISHYPTMHHTSEEIDIILHNEFQKFSSIWSSLTSKYHCAIIQNNFELPQNRILGNLDFYDVRGSVHYIHRLNSFFAEEAQARANLYINDIHYLAASIGLSTWFDKSMWYAYKYALSYTAIPFLAKSISAIIGALFGALKKCMVLDLDNTCWGGVIGDDGLNGIAIGKETAIAEAHTEFQQYAKTLKDRGVVLAVCSKNDMNHAKEGFMHPDTVLIDQDFAAFTANWEPKHHNIAKISDTLSLGLDSFVFIDDNPAERHIVRSNLSMVSVPEIGSDIVDFIDHIDKNHYFETVSLASDDLQRGAFYQKNKERRTQESHFTDYGEYLHSLEMNAEIKAFTPVYLARITQLINKTNQFNLTTKRYTLADVTSITQDANYITLYGKLEDKFGDNGLISIIIGELKNKECHIELWLMSCRVLKRTMEYAMFDALVAKCHTLGIKQIIGYYYPTEKNNMVSTLYQDFGFNALATDAHHSVWSMDVSNYINKNQHIRISSSNLSDEL
ncbi:MULTISPECIES: HAD-IIIC family phosphatase [Legionella]|uniref:HAD-IIIC family phosphatase n=1 Tax=Legionella TaxID=445 RepID=UPI00095C9A60|nr:MULTISPECIES: HAD-IIIC family phosphatase [Legionella]MBN9229020.1 HAD family hydrolase [Legionella steelei]OJW06422.1 MAG: hypothetical protein BGO44_15775 [Legionella sp. 39-23]